MIEISELTECRDCLCFASRSAARAITSVFDDHLRPHGLKGTQFTALVTLLLKGPTALGVLAKDLGLDRTTLTRNLSTLAERGWTRDEVDEADSRSRLISTTPAGQDAVKAAFPAWKMAQQCVAEILGDANAEAIRKMSRIKFRA